jgi:hypothetical protein
VSSVVVLPTGRGNPFVHNAPVAISPSIQPFVHVVNNTVHGTDGRWSFFSESAGNEPNDTIFNAVDTRQGRHAGPEFYTGIGQIGNTTNFPSNPEFDVDFFQFQLDVGDEVLIDIATRAINSSLDAVLRLFNSVGEELMLVQGTPGSPDPSLRFRATEPGTYYVGVSGAGNEVYSPLSLGSRSASAPPSTGAYRDHGQRTGAAPVGDRRRGQQRRDIHHHGEQRCRANRANRHGHGRLPGRCRRVFGRGHQRGVRGLQRFRTNSARRARRGAGLGQLERLGQSR